MPERKPPLADDPAESKRFIDMARTVGVDEDPEAFDRAFKRVVKPETIGTKRVSSEQKDAKSQTDC